MRCLWWDDGKWRSVEMLDYAGTPFPVMTMPTGEFFRLMFVLSECTFVWYYIKSHERGDMAKISTEAVKQECVQWRSSPQCDEGAERTPDAVY